MIHRLVTEIFSQTERENHNRWVEAHDLVCGCHGVTIHLTGGAIGTTVRISCPTLTRQHDLTDYDAW
jgi:hypothetical protein